MSNLPLKLGKAPARDDERTLRLASYLNARLPAPPPARDWLSKVPAWPMYRNDELGDCVTAGYAHLLTAWSTGDGNTPVVPTDDDVVAAYSAISGYDPATGANDHGCVMLDALNYWRTTGMAGHRVGAYVKVDHLNHTHVKQAIDLFGGLYVGVALPQAAQRGLQQGLWRAGVGLSYIPGSWGGHCIHVGAYTRQRLVCTTWGRTLPMTWGFWDLYVDEAYAIVSPDWLGADGKSPAGLDVAALTADLRAVTG